MSRNASRTEVLIGFLAVLSIFLVVLGNIMLHKGRFPIGVYTIDLFICGIFAWDFARRAGASDARGQFFRRNWYEPLSMVPAVALDLTIGLPIVSVGLRALRLVRFVRVVMAAVRLRRTFAVADRFAERSHLLYLVVITAGIVIAAAFAVLAIEFRLEISPINSVSDALWWSLATVTTVGYGDIVPATVLGRVIGMLLMVVGIGVMATLISQVSAALVESRMGKRAAPPAVAEGKIESLVQMVGNLPQLSDVELGTLLRDIIDVHRQAHTGGGDAPASLGIVGVEKRYVQ